jgi:hypothetical protein
VEASSIGQALREIAHRCPALEGSVLNRGTIQPVYRLSLNSDRFVSDPETLLDDCDVLLVISADAGG